MLFNSLRGHQLARRTAGHENLIDFGFMHFGGRVYDPDIGRFTSPDPYTEDLFSSQGLNKFGYVRGQATQRIDPSGYMSTDGGGAWSAGGAAIGAGIGGAIALGKGLRELIQNGSHHNGQGITPHALGTNLKNLLPVRSFSSATRLAARGVAVGTPSFGASHQGALRAWAGTNQLLEDNAGIIIRTLAEVAPHVVGFAAGITPSTLEQAYNNTNDRINRVSAELRAQHPLMSAYDVADGYARAATSYDVVRNAAWDQYKPANEVTKASFDISNFVGGLFTGGGGGQSFADDVAPLADDLAGAATLDASEVLFSQSNVRRTLPELVESMKASGWKGAPIDVVRLDGGQLVAVDNTRLLAAQLSGTRVQAVVHAAGEAFPAARAAGNLQGATWGEAVLNRIAGQKGAWRRLYPSGSPYTGVHPQTPGFTP